MKPILYSLFALVFMLIPMADLAAQPQTPPPGHKSNPTRRWDSDNHNYTQTAYEGSNGHKYSTTRQWNNQYDHAFALTKTWTTGGHSIKRTVKGEEGDHDFEATKRDEWGRRRPPHEFDTTIEWLRGFHKYSTTRNWLKNNHNFNTTQQWLEDDHKFRTSKKWERDNHDYTTSKRQRSSPRRGGS